MRTTASRVLRASLLELLSKASKSKADFELQFLTVLKEISGQRGARMKKLRVVLSIKLVRL